MDWPTPTDYRHAIQVPDHALADEELRKGQAARNARGLPTLWSGNFASVFRIDCPATSKTWALKCFTREVRARQERYRHIAAAVEAAQLLFTVPFQYLQRGVQVEGQWYPAVKMQWVEGQTLNRFVEESLDKPAMLRQLLGLWPKLAARLRDAGIAHADLQHGNVLLVRQRSGQLALRLIDYDGMYIPALAGTESGESGHPNYQHPHRREQGAYNLDVDRFSHLAIYCAVHSLSVKKRDLWPRFNNDENLLFRENDFRQPRQSELFRALWELDDPGSRALVGRLALACERPLVATPWVDEIVNAGEVAPLSPSDQRAAAKLLATRTVASVAGATRAPPFAQMSNALYRVAKSLLGSFLSAARYSDGLVAELVPIHKDLLRRVLWVLGPTLFVAIGLLAGKGLISALAPSDSPQHQEASDGGQPGNISIELGDAINLEMVRIPSGEFMMGSPYSDPNANSHERPQHRVRITRSFYLGKYPVTQQQWEAVMGANPSHFKGPRNPVEQVSWNDCHGFLARLNERAAYPGWKFRLPTEAEWEYACRAGTTTRYSFGDNGARFLDGYGWFNGNSRHRTYPVGLKLPNAWGLCDMLGNVREWCADWYDSGYYANSPVDDPTGPTSTSERVLRGGGWGSDARLCRSAHRGRYAPGLRKSYLGFRLALVPAESGDQLPDTARPEPLRLQPIADQRIEAGDNVRLTVVAENPERWKGRLGFALASGAPPGATIGPLTGRFTWTPVADQEPGTYHIDVLVRGPDGQEARVDFSIAVTRPPRTESTTGQDEIAIHPAFGQKGIAIDLGGGVNLEMVLIPTGEFMMGSPDSDRDAQDDERPQHRVRITKPFYLGKYEVTQEQWESVMGTNPSHFKGPTNPVETVGWDDCQGFLQKLNERAADGGREFRLPTEAEWEYACRAGTTTPYSFGDGASHLGGFGWYSGNSNRQTHPVGEKRPNPWGLYDVHGNVWEWCSDWFDGKYYANSPVDDPQGPASGSHRVHRGGGWYFHAGYCRSANRFWSTPVNRLHNLGFRLALVPADESGK